MPRVRRREEWKEIMIIPHQVNKDTLMKELGLGESLMDLSVILCFAEKTRPNSYKDVLGDPQKDIEHILTDLEFV